MQLSKDFTLAELERTSTGLPNKAPPAEARKLEELARTCLQILRDDVDVPLVITSGYRSANVNRHPSVGGALWSAHRYGCAADLHAKDNAVSVEVLWQRVKELRLPFDQAIWEKLGGKEWLHLGIARPGFGPARGMHFTWFR